MFKEQQTQPLPDIQDLLFILPAMDDFNKPGSMAQSVAKSEIEALFHRYAILANETPEIQKMAPLFDSNGVFRLPDGTAVHPAKLLEVVKDNNPDFIRHHITSIDIEFVNANEARTRSLFFAITHLSSMDHWGRWEDIVTRDKHGPWLIKDRSVIVEGGDPQGWYRKTYPI